MRGGGGSVACAWGWRVVDERGARLHRRRHLCLVWGRAGVVSPSPARMHARRMILWLPLYLFTPVCVGGVRACARVCAHAQGWCALWGAAGRDVLTVDQGEPRLPACRAAPPPLPPQGEWHSPNDTNTPPAKQLSRGSAQRSKPEECPTLRSSTSARPAHHHRGAQRPAIAMETRGSACVQAGLLAGAPGQAAP